jgi:hypothetical protein
MRPALRAERWFPDLSLARKLTAIGVIAAAASLVMAGAVFSAVTVWDDAPEQAGQLRRVGRCSRQP